jgi:hypothetical protein
VDNFHTRKNSKVLTEIAAVLKKNEITWFLGTSKVLVEIFVTPRDVSRLHKIFKLYITKPIYYFQDGEKRYLEFQMKMLETEVKIRESEIKKEELKKVDFKGLKIPVQSA